VGEDRQGRRAQGETAVKLSGIRPKALDFIVLALALGVIALIALRVYASGGQPVIEIRGDTQEWVFPLHSRETVEVSGPLGNTIVEVTPGAVRVVDSPCPEKICVKSGSISRPGQTIACLPNRVFVVIRGDPRDQGGAGIDAFSR
jgi:hypothetical protein